MSSQGGATPPDPGEVEVGEALKLGVGILALLMALVVQWGINKLLDCFLLDAGDRDRVRLSRMLPSSVLSAEDIQKWMGKHSATVSSSSEGGHGKHDGHMMCSICIHELHQGDVVFTAPRCNHVFHRTCIAEWVCNENGNACPNCRREILPKSALDQMLGPDFG